MKRACLVLSLLIGTFSIAGEARAQPNSEKSKEVDQLRKEAREALEEINSLRAETDALLRGDRKDRWPRTGVEVKGNCRDVLPIFLDVENSFRNLRDQKLPTRGKFELERHKSPVSLQEGGFCEVHRREEYDDDLGRAYPRSRVYCQIPTPAERRPHWEGAVFLRIESCMWDAYGVDSVKDLLPRSFSAYVSGSGASVDMHKLPDGAVAIVFSN
jgi:hypothetical protein